MPYRSPACTAGRHVGSQNSHPPAPTTTASATTLTAAPSHRGGVAFGRPGQARAGWQGHSHRKGEFGEGFGGA